MNEQDKWFCGFVDDIIDVLESYTSYHITGEEMDESYERMALYIMDNGGQRDVGYKILIERRD